MAGPPEFLNNAVGYVERKKEAQEVDLMKGRWRARRDTPCWLVCASKSLIFI